MTLYLLIAPQVVDATGASATAVAMDTAITDMSITGWYEIA